MASRLKIAAIVAIAAAVSALPLIAQRPASGPVARYDMRAGTISGMGAMGQMSPGAMMFGGGRGNNAQHELHLRLGSSRDPNSGPNPGAAKADHFMPPVAKLGKSVALGYREEPTTYDELPQQPKGRMLIYWGCGEHAPAGQPVVIDFAKLVKGQVPPGLWSTTVIRDWGPDSRNSKTFGRWPWDDKKYVKPDSSLIGAHRVVANYSPEIAFNLSKDFMQPLSARHTAQPSGSTVVNWTGIADATGYYLYLFGGKQGPGGREMGDMVMWSSSASRQFGGGLSDWLSPGQVAGLVRDRVVLAPSVSTCTVPAEVRRDAPDFRMIMLTAFGPEENFSYPPRPDNPRTPWHLEWTARVRHRSMTSLMDMPGMPDMSGMGGGQQQAQQGQQGDQPKCKPKRGLGGLLGGALGVPGGGC